MKNKFISIIIIGIMVAPILLSCEKAIEDPVKYEATDEPVQKIWPWVIAGLVTVIVFVSEGQATDVSYYENGNLEGYSCSGLGTCHIAISTSGNGTSVGSTDALYSTDKDFFGFELVSSDRGDVFLRTSLANPDVNGVFYDEKEWTLSIPFTIDNQTVMNTLGLNEPLKISGTYDVIRDATENLVYIKLN